MKQSRWYIDFLLSLSTAFILLLSFPPYNLNFLGFIGLAPILFITYTSGLKKTLIYGMFSAFLFYCLYLFWMNAYLAIIGVGFVTVVYGGYFVASLLFINLASSTLPKYRAFITPFIWISLEYARSFRFLACTFGSLGYTQHNFLPFIQIADIGGEPLVSFIIVLFNASIANFAVCMIKNDIKIRFPFLNLRILPIATSLILIAFSLVYGFYRLGQPLPQKPRMKIALIQGLSSPRTEWEKEKYKTLNRLLTLSNRCYQENPDLDLIVWTETAIRTSLRPNFIYGTPYHMKIQRLVKNLGIYFVIGSPDNYRIKQKEDVSKESLNAIYPTKGGEEIWTNSAYYLGPDGEILGKYDKIILTPFGEHFPLGKVIPFLQHILDRFTDSAGFTPGNEHTVFQHNPLDFSVVICWEGTYGYFIREFVKGGAQFMINISNDMWTKSEAGHFQHFTITKFRAIENRIWYARAGNDGVTAIINPYGEVVNILPIKEVGCLIGEVGAKARETFYTTNGDILPRISVAVLFISFVYSVICLLKEKKQITHK